VAELAGLVGDHFGRTEATWVADPEEALLSAVLARLDAAGPGGPPLAAPAWGRPSFREVLQRFRQVHWLEPAAGRLDPGPAEIREALDAGARAVLLAPIAGDGSALPEAAALCRDRGAVLALDARHSMGARVLEFGPEGYGDLILLPVDGEPAPAPCHGAVLCGAPPAPAPSGAPPSLGLTLALSTVLASLRDEPRLRRLWRPREARTEELPLPATAPAAWTLAAASSRLEQSSSRAMQRARHAQHMRVNFGHVPAVELISDPAGFQSAGAGFPVLARGREAVIQSLAAQGIPTLLDLADWLAPEPERGPRALDISQRALFLPLHPFFQPADIEAIGERLRRATLRTNGTGWSDPSESTSQE